MRKRLEKWLGNSNNQVPVFGGLGTVNFSRDGKNKIGKELLVS
ncbi:hypothetical protein MKX68_16175 [Paenibacillus sp. FSL M8-0212]